MVFAVSGKSGGFKPDWVGVCEKHPFVVKTPVCGQNTRLWSKPRFLKNRQNLEKPASFTVNFCHFDGSLRVGGFDVRVGGFETRLWCF